MLAFETLGRELGPVFLVCNELEIGKPHAHLPNVIEPHGPELSQAPDSRAPQFFKNAPSSTILQIKAEKRTLEFLFGVEQAVFNRE